MNIRKYFLAINCTLSHKAFVFNSLTSEKAAPTQPPRGEENG